MKLTLRGSKYYLVKRVPEKFSSIEKRKQIWIALRTDSLKEAKKRAYDAERDLENQWIATLSGKENHLSRVWMRCHRAGRRDRDHAVLHIERRQR